MNIEINEALIDILLTQNKLVVERDGRLYVSQTMDVNDLVSIQFYLDCLV